ncbi:pseudouridine synthase [Sphingomonas hominis]|uniref:pseudouridine synthase n=1 Tax=Sphingomonas hominis TaxID=2741495 RepID=UPI001FE250BD|nr:pseudouridine synthase [Sphingomonas hominis]
MAEEPAIPTSATHRIAKLLARAGVASRRDVERMIEDGRVALNGSVIDTPATLLATLDGVTVDGVPVAEAEPTRLFLFHKPAGYLTAARDPMGRPTIYDRLPADLPRLVPVGRLDLNTEGLLLLTTDGEFKRQLELPSTGVERAYRARAYGDVTQAQLEELIDGVEIDGIRYGSIDANLERRTGANVWVEMILTEGKNREVRRVLEHLGLQVSRLIRTRYGPFVMGDLPVGGIGEVRGADIVAFRHSLKNARLAPQQVGTITATAIRPGSSTRATSSAQTRPDGATARSDARASAGRMHSSQGEGYDPIREPTVSNENRRPTRGAFGLPSVRGNTDDRRAGSGVSNRTASTRSGEHDRTSRTSTVGAQRRAGASHGVNEPDGIRSRRPAPRQTPAPRDAADDYQPRPRPDPSIRGERGSDRATSRNRSGAIDPTHQARPFRSQPTRADRASTPRGDRDERSRSTTGRTGPERSGTSRSAPGERPSPQRVSRDQPSRDDARGRAQAAERGNLDSKSRKPATNRDDAPDAPRPPRPERKPGWARAKPKSGAKPGTRPGKPRK